MPHELNVGHRSRLVSALAWVLMLLGFSGLAGVIWRSGIVARLAGFSALDLLVCSLLACAGLLLLTAGQALLRRLEWGRRLSMGLGALVVAALPVLPAVARLDWFFIVPGVVVSLVIAWGLRGLVKPMVKREFA